MNKYLIHSLWLVLLFSLGAGCSNSVLESAYDYEEEDGMVTFDMALDFGGDALSSSRTRSDFSDSISWGNNYSVDETTEAIINPSEAKIIILVFDSNHLLSNVYSGAEYTGIGSDNAYHYSLSLDKSEQLCYLHVLVNFNELAEHLSEIPAATEADVFNSTLLVAQNRAVYWRRVEMTNGISETTVKESLSNLKLVRNYAKIRLKFDIDESSPYQPTDFQSFQWAIMCTPTMSYVAPYLSGQDFPEYINPTTKEVYDYSDLYNQIGYRCHTPRTVSNASEFYNLTSASDVAKLDEEDYSGKSRWKNWYEPIYCYENEGTSESSSWKKTTFLIKATTVDGEVWYYRLSMIDNDTQESLYIMRNIEYTITINGINDKGFSTAEEAFTKAAANNVVGSSRTSGFTSITYRDAALRVEYVKKYVLSEAPFTMYFRYIPDITESTDGNYTTANEYVVLKPIEGYNFYGEENTQYALKSEPTIDTEDTTSGERANYRKANFTPNKPLSNGTSTISKFRVQVNDTRTKYVANNALYRDVELILRERYKIQNMQIERDTITDSDVNNAYTLTVEIPDNMPSELFPIDFTFESSPSCVYPNADKSIMQVSGTDESLFNPDSTDIFHYHRNVTYSKYKDGYYIGNNSQYHIVFEKGENAGFKKITFYFRLIKENIPTNCIIKFAVAHDSFSENPSNPYQNPLNPSEEIDPTRVKSWPIFGTFKIEKDAKDIYQFTKIDETTDATE